MPRQTRVRDRFGPRPLVPGTYAGIALCEWRGTIRAVRRSGWYLFADSGARTRRQELHAAVVMAATLLLPLAWHKAHAGRLSPDYYRHRQAWLSVWRPLRRKV